MNEAAICIGNVRLSFQPQAFRVPSLGLSRLNPSGGLETKLKGAEWDFLGESSPIFTRATYKRAKDRNPGRTSNERIAGLRSDPSDRFIEASSIDSRISLSLRVGDRRRTILTGLGPRRSVLKCHLQRQKRARSSCRWTRRCAAAIIRLEPVGNRSAQVSAWRRIGPTSWFRRLVGSLPCGVPIDLAGSKTGFVLPRLRELINVNVSPTVSGFMKPDPGRETPSSGPE
jgi:hypothetical protein